MLLVTFDSNVWRLAAEPARFPKDPEHGMFVRIHNAIRTAKIEGRLSETIFTLEGVARAARRNFLIQYIAPDPFAHPGNNPYLSSHLNDALAAGFRLMHCPRIAGVLNPDLRPEWFVQSSDASAPAYDTNKFGEVTRNIETRCAGISGIKAIGKRYSAPTETWFQGLAKAALADERPIASAVAEWADADSVSAHVAYGNHFLCTRDVASAAGATSTFSAENRAWLTARYDVQFVTPGELASHV